MLMLVVTVIIAAVVSGFAGGLVGGEGSQKVPSLSMDVSIINSGTFRGSGFSAKILGVSEPIPTKDLKIVTSWDTTVKTNTYVMTMSSEQEPGRGLIVNPDQYPIGSVYHGGAEILPGIPNSYTKRTTRSVAPYGVGPGVGNLTESEWGWGGAIPRQGTLGGKDHMLDWQYFAVTHFGNYSLEQGTVMIADTAGGCRNNWPIPAGLPEQDGMTTEYYVGGYGQLSNTRPWNHVLMYQYQSDGDNAVYQVYTGDKTTPAEIIAEGGQADGMQAVLGCGWENLRAGDIVNVRVVHIPSGKTIFDKDVVVKES
ncbi:MULTISPECIES: type IV pilin [unclassified Methanoculleus]